MTLYWEAVVVGGEFQPNEETVELRWLTPREAIEILSHNDLKKILKKLYMNSVTLAARSEKFFHSIFGNNAYFRINAAIKSARQDLRSQTPGQHISLSNEILTLAEKEMHEMNFNEAWNYFNIANRIVLRQYPDGSDVLNIHAVALRKEADKKLSGWRKEAILSLLNSTKTITAESVMFAYVIRDDDSNNTYYRHALLKRQMAILAFVLALLTLPIFLYPNLVFPELADPPKIAQLLFPMALFGAIGSTLSGIINMSRNKSRIPEQIGLFVLSLVRILLGSISAIIVYVLIHAGIIEFKLSSLFGILAISFIAGFSENLLMRSIESLTNTNSGK
jgi:hypothetical protein